MSDVATLSDLSLDVHNGADPWGFQDRIHPGDGGEDAALQQRDGESAEPAGAGLLGGKGRHGDAAMQIAGAQRAHSWLMQEAAFGTRRCQGGRPAAPGALGSGSGAPGVARAARASGAAGNREGEGSRGPHRCFG